MCKLLTVKALNLTAGLSALIHSVRATLGDYSDPLFAYYKTEGQGNALHCKLTEQLMEWNNSPCLANSDGEFLQIKSNLVRFHV